MDNPNKEISSHVCGLDLATFSRLHKWSKTSSLWDKAQKLYLFQSSGKPSLGISVGGHLLGSEGKFLVQDVVGLDWVHNT